MSLPIPLHLRHVARYQEWQERIALSRFDRLIERLAAQSATASDGEIAADVAAARAELRTDAGGH